VAAVTAGMAGITDAEMAAIAVVVAVVVVVRATTIMMKTRMSV
jgi:hypothetical protein